jgi:hypothetical protein
VPGPFPLQQHRTFGQGQAPCLEASAQAVVRPPIDDAQVGDPTPQLAAQGEVAAEGATAVVDEGPFLAVRVA